MRGTEFRYQVPGNGLFEFVGDLADGGHQRPLRHRLVAVDRVVVRPAHRVFFFDGAYVHGLVGVDVGSAFLVGDSEHHAAPTPQSALAVPHHVGVPPWRELDVARFSAGRRRYSGTGHPLDALARGHPHEDETAVGENEVVRVDRQRRVGERHRRELAELPEQRVRVAGVVDQDADDRREWITEDPMPCVELPTQDAEQLDLLAYFLDELRPVTPLCLHLLLPPRCLPHDSPGH